MGATAGPARTSSAVGATPAERLAAARGVLARAEAGAGLRQRLSGVTALMPGPALDVADGTSADRSSAGQAAVDEVRTELPPELLLPAPEPLAALLPHGGLRRGTAVTVLRSTSLLLAMAARACSDGAWCAVVGMPDLGLAAAAEAGLDLTRTVVVPRPGPDALTVLAALVDGFDVVVLGRSRALLERDRRSLTSRVRTREAVLLVGQEWPGAQVVLEVGKSRWSGVGAGAGVLTDREVTVTARSRGTGPARSAQVRLTGGVSAVETSSAVPRPSAVEMPTGAVAGAAVAGPDLSGPVLARTG